MSKQPPVEQTEKVKLLKPHTHAGKDYAVGESINVRPSTAAWLAGQGIIAPRAAATTPTHQE